MLHRHFRQPSYKYTYLSTLTMDVVNKDISDLWRFLRNRRNFLHFICFRRLCPIIHIKKNSFVNDIGHIDVPDMDILYDPPSSTCCFKPYTFVGSHKGTIFYEDIPGTARHFAAHHEAAMA